MTIGKLIVLQWKWGMLKVPPFVSPSILMRLNEMGKGVFENDIKPNEAWRKGQYDGFFMHAIFAK